MERIIVNQPLAMFLLYSLGRKMFGTDTMADCIKQVRDEMVEIEGSWQLTVSWVYTFDDKTYTVEIPKGIKLIDFCIICAKKFEEAFGQKDVTTGTAVVEENIQSVFDMYFREPEYDKELYPPVYFASPWIENITIDHETKTINVKPFMGWSAT